MEFKTIGNSNPQGKQRVYFACHPDDFKIFFDDLSDEILHIQSCAVYYHKEDTIIDDNLRLELSQMQLVVIPVTSRLLISKNSAICHILPFALEKHIPVLPIMMESGLTQIFSNYFGDMQYLEKYSTDMTSISYEEKLRRYINSVLVGDETAEKVRKAFDAYIFLSYRKKDRKYAQQLMHLIHENEFARSIAIWYDEFLVPGESFNDAIADMLKKSDLFALVVTPSLTEPDNYVMRKEYPAAVEQGKKILPGEMLPTDADALRSVFDGISDCVDAYDKNALSNALLSMLRSIALDSCGDDPEHNFFIGLAYLNGIDVEVNHELALRLIVSSAEAGFPEATEKLVDMFSTGEGVERNYATAIMWQERLAALRRKQYVRTGAFKDYEALFFALWRLGDRYYESGILDLAKKTYEEMLDLCKGRMNKELTSEEQRGLSVSYGKLGNIAIAEGKLSEAKKYYISSMEISKGIAEKTQTIEARRDLSVCYGKLGNIAYAVMDLSGSWDYYMKATRIFEELSGEMPDIDTGHCLSVSYIRLGDIKKSEGKLNEAEDYYRRAVDAVAELAEETGASIIYRDTSASYDRLAMLLLAQGKNNEAKKYCLKALEISEIIAEETETMEARRDLAISYNALCDILKAEGKLKEAREYCLRALELRKAIEEETHTQEARTYLSISYSRLSNILQSDGRLSEAKEACLSALKLRRALAEETHKPEAIDALAISLNNIALICVEFGEIDEARKHIGEALKLCTELVSSTGANQYKRHLEAIKQFADALGEVIDGDQRLPVSSAAEKSHAASSGSSGMGSSDTDLVARINALRKKD